MQTPRNILIGLVVLVIVGLVIFKAPRSNPPQVSEPELADKAWATFQSYLAAAEAHDLDALKPLAYQLSSACSDDKRADECYKLMDQVVEIGKEYKREEFTQVFHDDKQVVLATDRHYEESDVVKASARRLIFLTRENDNDMKILFFTLPMQLTFTYKEGRTPEEIDARLSQMTIDTDADLADDEVENCTDQDEKCVKTDPNNRDTDGDGWWDGIEPLLVRAD